MEVLPAVALLLGAIGSLLAVYATVRGQQTNATESRLSLAWDMQEKQLDMLTEENKDLRSRIRSCDEQMLKLRETTGNELLDMRRQLSECRDGRRQLEIQVELLKLRLGGSSE